jgi:hypothetical protein
MTNQEVAKTYISHLENGLVEKVISLFTHDGLVHSPLYGTKSAKDFYTLLADDTSKSELNINGLFEDEKNCRLALYFNYRWTLKNGEVVIFDVVDIMQFNAENKIIDLKIIYDSINTRQAIAI